MAYVWRCGVDYRSPWFRGSIAWLLGIAVSSMGLAACITLLNLASRVIMGLGGFVALGGPYEISQPAPGWVLLIPGSILAGFAFGGLSMGLSSRTGGFSLISAVWSALFLSLGCQFAIMGLNPPEGGLAWGWILCALAFIPMGIVPIPNMLKGYDMFGMPSTMPWQAGVARPCDDPLYKRLYAVCVVVGAAVGVGAGIVLFNAIAG
jgi:hypothetical protein